MKVVAIVQARMGSTRLPGKVLMDLEGATVLARVVQRLRRARHVDEVLVATTDMPADDAIVAECRRISVGTSRGDQEDVLDRYYRAAQLSRAETIVRITSDCPLIDPGLTDETISTFLERRPDYVSNVQHRTYPRGLDTEVMSIEALAKAWRQATKKHEREHVTPYIYEHPDEFKILSVSGDVDHSRHRWTVDTAEDLEFVRTVYRRLGAGGEFSWHDALALLEREPELTELNRSVQQKALHDA